MASSLLLDVYEGPVAHLHFFLEQHACYGEAPGVRQSRCVVSTSQPESKSEF